jgi:hypothetical protein
LFIVKREFLKVPAFGAETHLAEGQWQEEWLNMVKLRMLQIGTRMTDHCLTVTTKVVVVAVAVAVV